MKNIKIILIIFVSCCFISNSQTVYLYTPNGSQVYAFKVEEMSQSDIAYINNQYASAYPNAQLIGNASRTYNCHSYAWNLTEGGTDICWLNQNPDLNKYWNDGSYQQVSESNAVKIFYYDGDHSAVKSTTHAGKYESKWGQAPLMRHAPDYGPYNQMQNRRYYARNCNQYISNKTFTGYYSLLSCGTITVSNTTVESTGDVNLRARDYIRLNPGFTVKPGGHFNAEISTNAFRSSPTMEVVISDEEIIHDITHVVNEQSVSENSAWLAQNEPNPFRGQSLVAYYIPETVSKASIQITDLTGRVMKDIPLIQRGRGEICIESSNLTQGFYSYSLILDGNVFTTKKLIVTN